LARETLTFFPDDLFRSISEELTNNSASNKLMRVLRGKFTEETLRSFRRTVYDAIPQSAWYQGAETYLYKAPLSLRSSNKGNRAIRQMRTAILDLLSELGYDSGHVDINAQFIEEENVRILCDRPRRLLKDQPDSQNEKKEMSLVIPLDSLGVTENIWHEPGLPESLFLCGGDVLILPSTSFRGRGPYCGNSLCLDVNFDSTLSVDSPTASTSDNTENVKCNRLEFGGPGFLVPAFEPLDLQPLQRSCFPNSPKKACRCEPRCFGKAQFKYGEW